VRCSTVWLEVKLAQLPIKKTLLPARTAGTVYTKAKEDCKIKKPDYAAIFIFNLKGKVS